MIKVDTTDFKEGEWYVIYDPRFKSDAWFSRFIDIFYCDKIITSYLAHIKGLYASDDNKLIVIYNPMVSYEQKFSYIWDWDISGYEVFKLTDSEIKRHVIMEII